MPPTRPKRGPPKVSLTAYTSSAILKSTSVLTKPSTDLPAFLLTCLTSWSDYTEAQKHQIISSLPPTYQIRRTDSDGKLECPLSIEFIREDNYLREGIEKFKRDVGEGYFDPTWRKNAAMAMREREEGRFDDYLRDKVEAEFGDIVAEEDEEQETSQSDKEWGMDKSKGGGKAKAKGKNIRGEKGRGRTRRAAARGELQSAVQMDG